MSKACDRGDERVRDPHAVGPIRPSLPQAFDCLPEPASEADSNGHVARTGGMRQVHGVSRGRRAHGGQAQQDQMIVKEVDETSGQISSQKDDFFRFANLLRQCCDPLGIQAIAKPLEVMQVPVDGLPYMR